MFASRGVTSCSVYLEEQWPFHLKKRTKRTIEDVPVLHQHVDSACVCGSMWSWQPTQACGVICAYQVIRALLLKVLYEWELYERQTYPIYEAELNKLPADHYIYPGLCIWICVFDVCSNCFVRVWTEAHACYTQIIVHIYTFKCKLVDHTICNPFETCLLHTC